MKKIVMIFTFIFVLSCVAQADWTYFECVDHLLYTSPPNNPNMYLSADTSSPLNAVTVWNNNQVRYRTGQTDGYNNGTIYEVHKGDIPAFVHINAGVAGTYRIKVFGGWSADNNEWALQTSIDGGATWSDNITRDSVSAVDGIEGQGWVTADSPLGSAQTISGLRGNVIIGNVTTTDGNIFIGIRVGGDQRGRFDGVAYKLQGGPENPDPSKGEENVEVDLSARDVPGAVSWDAPDDPNIAHVFAYNVYIDPNQNKVLDATAAVPGTLYSSAGQAGTSFDPGQDLSFDETYYWRVEAVVDYDYVPGGQIGDANAVSGGLWSFTTEQSAPYIDTDPADQFVFPGDTVVFTLSASSAIGGSVNYSWYYSSDDVVGDDILISTGIDANSLAVNVESDLETAITHEGYYYCVVDNGLQSTSGLAQLTVKRMIGQWLVDGVSTDSSGNGNNGTIHGDPKIVAGPELITGPSSARQFDGVDDYMTVTIDDVLNKYDVEMTVAFWIRNDGETVNYRRILNYGYYHGRIDIFNENNTVAARYADSGDFANADLGEDQWDHYVATMDGTTVAIYKNGGQTETVAGTYSTMRDVLGEPIVFAARETANSEPSTFGHFSISDVRVYNYKIDRPDVARLYMDLTDEDVCYYGSPASDLSGPEGEPDCVVNLYDLAFLAGEWFLDGFLD